MELGPSPGRCHVTRLSRPRSAVQRLVLLAIPPALAGTAIAVAAAGQARSPSALVQLGLLSPTLWLQLVAARRTWNAPMLPSTAVIGAASVLGLALAVTGAYLGGVATLVVIVCLSSPVLLQDLANWCVVAEVGHRALARGWSGAGRA